MPSNGKNTTVRGVRWAGVSRARSVHGVDRPSDHCGSPPGPLGLPLGSSGPHARALVFIVGLDKAHRIAREEMWVGYVPQTLTHKCPHAQATQSDSHHKGAYEYDGALSF